MPYILGAVKTVSNQPGPADAGADAGVRSPGPEGGPARSRAVWAAWLEALGVAVSAAFSAQVLRLRLMAPSDLPDPAIHTTYIIDPHQVFTRYAAVYASTARLRESARVGFLVPARLAYLAFGPAGGFFVLRYLLALIAVAPVYLLLRRVYGRPAAVVGVLVVLSSPVLVTAWGTDYPDSAVVSYAAGALACLAMPCSPRWRRGWLAAAGVLLTAAVWSHGVAVPLVGATMVAYLAVRLMRDRAGLPGDLVLLAGVAAAVTATAIAAPAVLIGHANFIATTWQAYRYLSQPSQVTQWHSANWRWAPYVAYLLVPPAVLGGFAVAVARRGHPGADGRGDVRRAAGGLRRAAVLRHRADPGGALLLLHAVGGGLPGVRDHRRGTGPAAVGPPDRPVAARRGAARRAALLRGRPARAPVRVGADRSHPGRGADRLGRRGPLLWQDQEPAGDGRRPRRGARGVRRRQPGAHRR